MKELAFIITGSYRDGETAAAGREIAELVAAAYRDREPEITLMGDHEHARYLVKAREHFAFTISNPGGKTAELFREISENLFAMAGQAAKEDGHLFLLPFADPMRLRIGAVVGVQTEDLTRTATVTVRIKGGEEVTVEREEVDEYADPVGDPEWAAEKLPSAVQAIAHPSYLTDLCSILELAGEEGFNWGVTGSDPMLIVAGTEDVQYALRITGGSFLQSDMEFPEIGERRVPNVDEVGECPGCGGKTCTCDHSPKVKGRRIVTNNDVVTELGHQVVKDGNPMCPPGMSVGEFEIIYAKADVAVPPAESDMTQEEWDALRERLKDSPERELRPPMPVRTRRGTDHGKRVPMRGRKDLFGGEAADLLECLPEDVTAAEALDGYQQAIKETTPEEFIEHSGMRTECARSSCTDETLGKQCPKK